VAYTNHLVCCSVPCPLMLRVTAPPPARTAARRASSALTGRKTTATTTLLPPPSATAGGKGFSSSTPASSTSPASKAKSAPKKQKAGPPPASSGKPRRSGGRGALRRTEQAARLGLGTASRGGSSGAGGASTPVPAGRTGEWVRLAGLSEWRPGKAGKAVTLPDGTPLCLYSTADGRAFASDIYSTAFKFPMVDADVEVAAGSPGAPPIATVPFDGTRYSLVDGSVIEWCPSSTPVRALLGALKSRAPPTPLTVYPARVAADGEGVEVWFAR
jgi:hypothetical protein